MKTDELQTFADHADGVGRTLKALGNGKRLQILCKLAQFGELNVSALADEVGLSPSALSQHLARLREEELVATRRDSQTIWYRIANQSTEDLMTALYGIYCDNA